MARLPILKTLAGFGFSFQHALDRNRITALAGFGALWKIAPDNWDSGKMRTSERSFDQPRARTFRPAEKPMYDEFGRCIIARQGQLHVTGPPRPASRSALPPCKLLPIVCHR